MSERSKVLALFLCSLFFGLFIFEIALRILGISYPYFTQVDEHRGYALRPHAEGWQRDEGEAYVKINSHGLRNEEITKKKLDGTFRIAVLGDSYTEARQVDVSETFTSKLRKHLGICLDQRVEPINFGVSGYGTAQEYLTLKHHASQFEPDAVIVLFFSANDVRNNSYALDKKSNIPYFDLDGDSLVLDVSFEDTAQHKAQSTVLARLVHRVINSSRTLQLLNRARIVLRNQSKKTPTETGPEPGLSSFVYREPQNDTEEEAWVITERILEFMDEESRDLNADFTIVTVPSSVELKDIDDTHHNYAESRIESFGNEKGISTILLQDRLREIQIESGKAMHGFPNTSDSGHWNAYGQEVAANIVSTELCRKWTSP